MPGTAHFPRVVAVFEICDYLIARERELGLGVSAHHIKTKIPGLPGQTSERLRGILVELVEMGWVEKNPYGGDRVLYRISEKGKRVYKDWGNKVLEFYGRPTYKLTKPK